MFFSLTLLQAYPSCSGNKHREHDASRLVATRSESEPVFKVRGETSYETQHRTGSNERRSSLKAADEPQRQQKRQTRRLLHQEHEVPAPPPE